MGIINVEDIKPGMVLAEAVKDRRGRILLNVGNPITEKQLKILKMWGITEADIQDVEREEVVAKAVAELDPSLLQEAGSRVQELFRHTDPEHPVVHELFRLCLLRAARRALKGGTHDS